ncbi:L-seryl-tRNA(Sec) kinase-like [Huso huso]|uniref:L-seryl-tRNA(Sec) kinase-like n=1 Tax=Huso huso TaxID=61971 RepID=A0ABR0ZRC4_HUSHU
MWPCLTGLSLLTPANTPGSRAACCWRVGAVFQKMIALFDSALDNPLKPSEDNTEQKEADRLCCATSVLHQADQVSLVSLTMKTTKDNKLSPDNMRLLAAELSKLEGDFLEDLSGGQVRGNLIRLSGRKEDVVRYCKSEAATTLDKSTYTYNSLHQLKN